VADEKPDAAHGRELGPDLVSAVLAVPANLTLPSVSEVAICSITRLNSAKPASSCSLSLSTDKCRISLKRAATLKDVAAAVDFLCSEDADYITGQTIIVDGGIV
jgi:NAD(P)-dependent dehydrogenase (short-subunit alcohol dehydrogenase family)